jgi:hypothetical protein
MRVGVVWVGIEGEDFGVSPGSACRWPGAIYLLPGQPTRILTVCLLALQVYRAKLTGRAACRAVRRQHERAARGARLVPRGPLAPLRPALHSDIEDGAPSACTELRDSHQARYCVPRTGRTPVGRHPLTGRLIPSIGRRVRDLLEQPHHVPLCWHGDRDRLIRLAVLVAAFGLCGLCLLRSHRYDASATRPRRAAVQPPPLQEPLATVTLLEGRLYPSGHGGPADAAYRHPVVARMMRLSRAWIGFDPQALRRGPGNYYPSARLTDESRWRRRLGMAGREYTDVRRTRLVVSGTPVWLMQVSYRSESGNGGVHDTTGEGCGGTALSRGASVSGFIQGRYMCDIDHI